VWVSAARSVTLTNPEIRGALEIRDTASFTLDRVTVRGSPGDGVVIEASSGAVRGCTIEDAKGSGIVVSFGSRVPLVNSAVRRSAKAGISLTLGSQARITRLHNRRERWGWCLYCRLHCGASRQHHPK